MPTGPRGYTIVDLGTFGGPTANAYAINNLGEVVGDADLPTGARDACIWRDGVISPIILELRPGVFEPSGVPADINDLSQVIVNTESDAYLWENAVTTRILGLNPGGSAQVRAINQTGQVIGNSNVLMHGSHPFIWRDGNTRDLAEDIGEASHSFVTDVNNFGHVAGYLQFGSVRHAMYWDGATTSDLGTLGGNSGSASALNDRAQVVGGARRADATQYPHAFLWQEGEMTDLGLLGNFSLSVAEDINNCGEILVNGWLFHSDFGFRSLESLIAPKLRWYAISPNALNDRGQIVGYGIRNGLYRAFLMTPVSGDLNLDGPIDLMDFSLFWARFTTADVAIFTKCERSDLDHDGELTLSDYSVLQRVFTGPR